ncbi:MAG: response regulator transcription factor [Alphaproteobacteria bacterium]|nr:MAG: response regulator transcription factor [Alphaproteobacteria bacterium]
MAGTPLDQLHILLAMGNAQAAASLKDILMRQRVGGVFAPTDNRDAVEQMQSRAYNLVVIDEKFPHLGGIDFCRFLRLTTTPMALAPIIFGLHAPDQKTVLQARDAGATKIAVMPFSGASLLKAIEDAANDTRAIVQSTSYNGPDRRVRQGPLPAGGNRRSKNPDIISDALKRRILANVKS